MLTFDAWGLLDGLLSNPLFVLTLIPLLSALLSSGREQP